MSANDSNERLMRFLQATPEHAKLIDDILTGRTPSTAPASTGPLLLGMGAGAKFLGVSRPTLWRMIRAGKLMKVEVLAGSFRLRRADLELQKSSWLSCQGRQVVVGMGHATANRSPGCSPAG